MKKAGAAAGSIAGGDSCMNNEGILIGIEPVLYFYSVADRASSRRSPLPASDRPTGAASGPAGGHFAGGSSDEAAFLISACSKR